MISKIELYIENEAQAKTIADEMRHRGIQVVGPYYCNGYGAPINYPRFKDDIKSLPEQEPELDYPDGEEG